MVKIIYHCYGGAHSSVLAAAVHLGILDIKDKLNERVLASCPFFDKTGSKDAGRIFFMGKDESGNDVFIMGCKNAGEVVERALMDFSRLTGFNEKNILLVNTLPYVNILLRIGGLFSRKLGLTKVGRLFLVPGAGLALKNINELVKTVKSRL